MSWLTTRIAAEIAGAVAAALAMALLVVAMTKNATLREVRGQLATAVSERDQAKADLQQCRANRLTLEDATARQNAAVEAEHAAGAARLAALTKAADQAKAGEAAATAKAKAILAKPGSTCEDADALIAWSITK